MLKRLGAALIVLLLACGYALAASSTLSGLSAGTTITDGDLFYDVQSPGSGGVKITASQLATYLASKGVGVVNVTSVMLTSSQILNAATTPIQVVPAQGAHVIVTVLETVYSDLFDTTAYSGGPGGLYYGALSNDVAADGGDAFCPTGNANTVCPAGSLTDDALVAANVVNQPVNYGVCTTCAGSPTAYISGDSTMKVTVFWTVAQSQ